MSQQHVGTSEQNLLFAQDLNSVVRDAATSLGLSGFDIAVAGERPLSGESRIAELRRRRRRRRDGGVDGATLVDVDGVLRWELGTVAPSRRTTGRRGRRRGGARALDGRVLSQVRFTDLPPNRVGALLEALDRKLNPNQGLHAIRADGVVGKKQVSPVAEGRILLVVHGTFSNATNVLNEITSTPEGRAFVRDAVQGGGYSQVLAFDHPTLAVAPVLNAVTLNHLFRGSKARVDTITHSRGGLVARWWREHLDDGLDNDGCSVFVGSPLAGTGLASPANLKQAFDLLTNIANGLKYTARVTGAVVPMAAPLTEGVAVLMSVVGKITAAAAKTPLLDAGVAMIPGLGAQAREGANGEIVRMRVALDGIAAAAAQDAVVDRYRFVRSNFETESPGWRFWRAFRGIGGRTADAAADIVFSGENDLVVDTPSMTSLGDAIDSRGALNASQILDFGTNDRVHHLNYFEQPETIDFLRTSLEL